MDAADRDVLATHCMHCGEPVPAPRWLADLPEDEADAAYQRWLLEPCGACGWSPRELGVR
jgi:hypothetical protein